MLPLRFLLFLFFSCLCCVATPLVAQNIAPGAIVNINRADPVTISRYLKGIGPIKAEAIVAYRQKYGPFKSVEELADVKGIGEKTIVRLKPFIRLE